MTITIYTARFGYRGADRMDITRGQVEPDPVGHLLAPSRWLLREGLRAREAAQGDPADEAAAWAWYREQYIGEQRHGLRADRLRLDPVFERAVEHGGELTLMCFCVVEPPALYCHRFPAAEILGQWGPRRGFDVRFAGERVPPAPRQTALNL